MEETGDTFGAYCPGPGVPAPRAAVFGSAPPRMSALDAYSLLPTSRELRPRVANEEVGRVETHWPPKPDALLYWPGPGTAFRRASRSASGSRCCLPNEYWGDWRPVGFTSYIGPSSAAAEAGSLLSRCPPPKLKDAVRERREDARSARCTSPSARECSPSEVPIDVR